MFDLNQAISDWRRQMLDSDIKTPVPLDELENHLRDDVEDQMRSGLNAQQAFDTAVLRIGRAGALRGEFSKAGGRRDGQRRRFMRIYYVVFPVFYSVICAYGLLRIEMNVVQRILGFTAVALTALPLWSTPWFHKVLPVIRDGRIRMTIQIAGILSWLVCGLLFMNVVLPRLNLSESQIMVTVLWLVMPVATISGLAYGLGDAAQRQTATADS